MTVSPTGTQAVFGLLEAGDLDGLAALLSADPMLVHTHHADPERYHWSALQFAAANGWLDACRMLVERGAEVYTNPWNTYPPVIQAAWNNHQEVVDYFLKEIPDRAAGTNRLGVSMVLAAREGWTDLVREHLARDPLSVHQRGWIGETPLHWASHNGSVAVMTLLIDANADIEADEVGCYGGKPLHWAAEHEPAAVRLLLERGAEVDSRNRREESEFHGMTPLIMNATQKNDCSEVTDLLLRAGAAIDAIDAAGKTALEHARERGRERITRALESHRTERAV